MLLLWTYSIFIGFTAITLASVTAQRSFYERRYRSGEAERLRSEKQKLLLLERERLTREMHDGLGGQLVSVLSMVERGLAAPSEVAEALRRAIDDIRIVIDSLDPDTTDLPTALGKLRARLEPLLRRNGIALSWSIDEIPGLAAFAPEAALHVLRIIQEAVTNTLRHADADSVEVRITAGGDRQRQLHISIRDDGRGLPTGMTAGGRGIKNMNSRAEELGAALRIEGTSSGTQIDLTVPVPR
jgi:signal transduction histidine kinase